MWWYLLIKSKAVRLSSERVYLPCRKLWGQLIECSIPRDMTDGQLPKVSFKGG